jgi:hypothetical protein
MLRSAQIRSAIRDRPWDWAGCLIAAVYLAVAFGSRFGPYGILAAIIAWGLLARFVLASPARRRHLRLSQIGAPEMEIADCEPSGVTKSGQKAALLFAGALFALAFCLLAADLLFSFMQGSDGWEADLSQLAKYLFFAVGYAAMQYWSYRNSSHRLLVTDQGLFLIFDPTRPWPIGRDIHEPDSPLRAAKIYGWEQIARFHWSRQRERPILHLNVRQPGISVPQLISYKFPTLSDTERQHLDELLRKYVAGTASSEVQLSSPASAPMPIGFARPA